MVAAHRAGARDAGGRVRFDVDPDAVGLGQPLGVVDLRGGAGGGDPPRREQDDLVGHGGCLVQVVQDDADGHAVGVGEIAYEIEDLHLVAQVEIGRRFVEQQHVGVLRQAAGEPDALQLTAGEALDAAIGEVGEVGDGERVVDPPGAVGVAPAQTPPVGVAAESHHVPHAQPRRGVAALGEQGDAAGEVVTGQGEGVDRLVVAGGGHRHRAGAGLVEPGDGAQQGGLPAAVRPDQGGDPTARQPKVGPVDDVGPVVRDGHVTGVEADVAGGTGVAGGAYGAVRARGEAGRGGPERRAVFTVVGRSDHDGEGSLTLILRCTRYAERSVPRVAGGSGGHLPA
ncbi:protein of unknown function [Streptomyces sp. KY70]|nr:protein of unknown function [Streptomyces sp. KY70]